MSDDELLDGLRAVGDADSEGAFGVDEARAREQLRAWLLPRREQYAVKLLQSAVQARASRFDVQTSRATIRFTHDGKPPSPEQLEGILGFLLSTKREKLHLQSLALAINAALSDERAEVRVAAWDGSAGHALYATASGSRIEAIPRRGAEPRHQGVAIEVTRPAFRLLTAWPEVALLRQAARYAPILVRLDGVGVSAEPYGERAEFLGMGPSWRYVSCVGAGTMHRLFRKGHHVIEARYPPVRLSDPTFAIQNGSLTSFGLRGEWSSDAPLRHVSAAPEPEIPMLCRAVLGFCADPGAPPNVQVVSHGALLGRLAHPSLAAGLVGIVAVDDLPTDITGLVVQAEALEQLAEDVRRNTLGILQVLRTFTGTTMSACLAHVLTGRPGTRLVVM